MTISEILVDDYAPDFATHSWLQSQFNFSGEPQKLRVRGDVAALLQKRKQSLSIAIIGTRKPSDYGLEVVQRLVESWRDYPFTIVSGGALGIDAEAHSWALKMGLSTRAWLVGPLENPSPQTHANLFRRIEEQPGSALLVPPELEPTPGGQGPFASWWLQRNLWVAADSHCAVVIEADLKSGTWSTVKAFNDLGRDVFVVPGPVFAPRSRGTNLMISRSCGQIVADFNELTQSLVVAAQQNSYNRV